jgi:hypothetical protein
MDMIYSSVIIKFMIFLKNQPEKSFMKEKSILYIFLKLYIQ